MKVENKVRPNQEQMAGFSEAGPDGPIYMVNLLRFKHKAEYQDGRATTLSGRGAYDLYVEGVSKLLAEVGGSIVFNSTVERLMLGEVEDLWDSIAIAMYPSRGAMLKMMMTDGMQEISAHREAGLEGQLNIETTSGEIPNPSV